MATETEIDIQRKIQLDLSDLHTRLWRNNCGQAWLGSTFSVINGRLVSGSARRVKFGIAGTGGSDLVGPHSVVITPEMVGTTIAIFCGIETKTKRGRATPAQKTFIRIINELGGRAGIARSVEDARKILAGEQP